MKTVFLQLQLIEGEKEPLNVFADIFAIRQPHIFVCMQKNIHFSLLSANNSLFSHDVADLQRSVHAFGEISAHKMQDKRQ